MDDLTERVARALCNSKKFETGEGGCAAICMSVLGSSRGGPHGCPEAKNVHCALAQAAIRAVLDGIRDPDSAMIDAGNAALGRGMVNADNAYTAVIDHLREKLDD